MAIPTAEQVSELLARAQGGWSAGSGDGFAAAFADDARFVAFDGTVLRGPREIAAFHQPAFDRHLKNTQIEIIVEEMCALGESALLVFASGGIRSRSGESVALTGISVQTIALVLKDGQARIQAFQNTRKRPIRDARSADVWKTFDRMWGELTDAMDA